MFVVLFAGGLKPLALISGGSFFVVGIFGWKFFLTKDIDNIYEKCRETVPTIIRTHLQKLFVEPINELVDDVFEELVQVKETELETKI